MNVVNPGRGEVALVVGAGVSLTLRFTTGALSSLQEAFGFPHTAEGCALLFARLSDLKPLDLPVAVFHGLAHRDRAVMKNVGVVATLLAMEPVGAAASWSSVLSHALRLAFPDPEGEKKKAAVAAPAFSWSALKLAALRAGMTTEDFWRSTPREIREVIRAASWRNDQAMATTWLGAAWSRQGTKMPALSDFVSEEYAPKPQPRSSPDLVTLAKAWGSNVYDETGELIVASGSLVEKPLKDKN